MIKKFDGKTFVLEKSFQKKKSAEKMAKQIRKIRNVRVIKERDIWNVYVKR